MILLDEGAHLEQRKLLLPAFHGERMQRMAGLMAELTERELDSWPLEQPVALHPRLQRLTLEIILRAVFGLDQGPTLDELRDALTDVLAFSESPLSVLPAMQKYAGGWFPPLRRFIAQKARADELMFDLIEERRAEGDQGREDVLSTLLQARHEDGSEMAPQELRDELMTALVAGHETTASQLAWAFERLARESRVAQRLADEIDAGVEDEYLTATINEILRLKPVLPNAEPRLTKRRVRIGDFEYPAGVALLASSFLVQHDPAIYPEPVRVQAGAIPRRHAGHVHVDSVRRRAPAMPRRELRAPGDEDRPTRRVGEVRALRAGRETRTDRTPEHHVQSRWPGHRDPARAPAGGGPVRRRSARRSLNSPYPGYV